jgi:histidyl-tRNA synthetase
VLRWLKELRARGIPADTDYAGRSLRGQLTQAGRLGAETIVVVGRDGATVRRQGQADESVSHDELPGRLLA